ncbi:hypothetical protein DFR27_1127 [Umboniibacter marinipuniceus]|uniref:Uncharacterized protein n=2 Tax=Umboniibacter marinipuniceus TaxID=569599 RepID=A0A3M0A8X1_9GAMM|nr:hypothetical protein DFR27_1127 [Umboniibacter marinipuniceus]
MMCQSKLEKIALEHDAAKLFMRAYEQRFGIEVRHIWHNEPRRPDVSCYLGDDKLDLEIAHLYGSEAQAMEILGRELTSATRAELAVIDLLDETHERLVTALNRILAGKAKKCYDSPRVWLVIRNANPAWNATDIHSAKVEIQVPENTPFEQIWMVGDWQGSSGIVRLD